MRTATTKMVSTIQCQQLAIAQFMPTQKAELIAAYQFVVAAMVPQGWLTPAQATILVNGSKGL
jgi:hypothetical protein